MDDLREVIDIGCHRVVAIRGPGAIAVTAQIRGHHVPVGAQAVRHPIPASAMISAAVQEQQRRGLRISPIDVVKL